MLDGAARIKDLVKAAVEDGQPALGITDHGNMYGVLDFYKACRDGGINPVIGTEAYMAAESRHERPTRRGKIDDTGGDSEGGEKLYYHLTLLAETTLGYRNLMKLSSAAYIEGYYYKPRLDWELLQRHHEGLIATTGCLGGVVLQALLRGDEKRAEELAGRLQDIFGKDNLFVELQDHGLAEQSRTNPALVRIANRLGAPLLATNDSHYVAREDSVSHDALLCVQTGAMISDPKRFKFEGEEHYLKSSAEMRSLFAELPQAADNTLWIAERAQVEIELGKPKLPEFPIPKPYRLKNYEDSSAAYLRDLAYSGAKERYSEPLEPKVTERLEHELGIIADMGFSAYFLVVWDLIRYARERGIRVGPGRGSAAGCCVAYCLKIVDLDPIKYDLLFERFLNPGRKQMPDIDMDFDERYRSEMIRYAADRYGSDHVAQIVTFSTIKARAAVRDAARVLGYPYVIGDRVAKLMPPLMMGRDTPLWACLDLHDSYEEGWKMAAELREVYASDPDVAKVVDVAKGLEGLRRQDGIHAAAVVISHEPLTEYLPIQRKPEPGSLAEDAPIVTQYEMHGVEELGLLKMDFLGLRNLSVIERALDLIEETTSHRPDIDNVALDDEATLAMLRRAESVGVFQLEGGPMRSLMRSLAPTSFDDIAALVALYRPGPMAANMHNDYADRKNDRRPISYLHPDLEPILGDTYGLMIYQESVMRVAQKFAGYSLEEADNLRKACGKKIRALIAAEREKFVSGCISTGYGEEIGTKLFDIIEPFADYAFNKSHSYGYGLVAYQTAWLKAHFPVQYLAALLTSVRDDKDKTAVYLAEARSIGVKVLVPDINSSEADFTAVMPNLESNSAVLNGSEGEPDDVSKVPVGAGEQKRNNEQKGTQKGNGEQNKNTMRKKNEAVCGLIPFGMAAVRNVGKGLVGHIVQQRRLGGPYTDFYDFCQRVDPTVLNKRTLESLIKSGAFDSLGHPRQGLSMVFSDIVDRTLARRREADAGIMSLFGGQGEVATFDDTKVPIPQVEFEKVEKLRLEREMLGLYISDHPLMGLEGALRRMTDCTLAEMMEAGREVPEVRSVGGVVASLVRRYTKKGDPMATFFLEDLSSSVETFVFPKVMASCGHLLQEDAVVIVRGRLDNREDTGRLVVMDITRPELQPDEDFPLRLRLPPLAMSEEVVAKLKDVLLGYPGTSPVLLEVGSSLLRLPLECSVDPRSGIVGELRELLGPGAVVG